MDTKEKIIELIRGIENEEVLSFILTLILKLRD